MQTGALFMGLGACSASQDTSKGRSGGFPIEADSDIETTKVGDTANSLVPQSARHVGGDRVSVRESEGLRLPRG